MHLRKVIAVSKLVPRGGAIPRFYGVAYTRPLGFEAVCYPIPLNILVRWAVSWWYLVKVPGSAWWERLLTETRNFSFEEGLKLGREAGPDGKHIFSKSQMRRISAQSYAEGQNDLVKSIQAAKVNPEEEEETVH